MSPAKRAFLQAARNLRVTGYVTQETIGQMLQDGIR